MGLLKADQVRNASGLGNADLFKQWAAKAWANLNGQGTIALRDSRNVASATDLGIGDYGLTLTSALTNANFTQSLVGDGGDSWVAASTRLSQTSSYIRIGVYAPSARGDTTQLSASINGDLA
jgi:hypothetical protein